MKVKVELNNLRTAPRKVRLVADLVRGKKANDAQTVLSFTPNKSSLSLLKLLNSAIASAKHNFKAEESNLYVSEIFVDEGPKLKRWHPMSRGRAYPIMKRTSHITLVLSDGVDAKNKEEKVEKNSNTKEKISNKSEKNKVSKPKTVSKAKKIKKT